MVKNNKLIALVLVGVLGCSVFAGCGGNGDDPKVDTSKTTVIYVANCDGGYGGEWLEEAADRFEKENANTVFEEGKQGIYIDIDTSRDERLSTMSTSGYNIYFYEQQSEVRDLAQGGFLLELNDVLTEKYDTRDGQTLSIEDKIPVERRSALKGRDGNYYGLPHFEYVPGISYDQDLFDKNNLYFADDSESSVSVFSCSYGDARFVASATAKKHCGNDGVYGTEDDGLPTTLQDMLILCAKMKQLGIVPFTFTGGNKTYAMNLEIALWASLAGYDEMRINYTFDGELEVVDYDHPDGPFTDEPLFKETGSDKKLASIKKPRTKTITVTEATGYKIYDSAARYYAMSFLQAVQTLGWFSHDSETTTVSHTDAQGKFIYNGMFSNPKIGMILEGNYWWNETEEKAQNLSSFYADTGKTERNIAWMSLPTSLDGPAPKEGVANEVTYVEMGASYCVVNANIKNKPDIVNAVKKFLQFLYSDVELDNYAASTGTQKALINHTVSDSVYNDMDNFEKSFQNVVKSGNGKIVYAVADNATFLANPSIFKIKQYEVHPVSVTVGGIKYDGHLDAMRNSVSLREIFEATRYSSSDWAAYYQGD